MCANCRTIICSRLFIVFTLLMGTNGAFKLKSRACYIIFLTHAQCLITKAVDFLIKSKNGKHALEFTQGKGTQLGDVFVHLATITVNGFGQGA